MEENTAYRFSDWLAGAVMIAVPESVIQSILVKRNVDEASIYGEIDEKTAELCQADLYSRIALTSPSRTGSVSDSDNGWTHSDGGFNLSEYDKKLLLDEANLIYEKYGEPKKGVKTKVTIKNYGIKRGKIFL